MVLAKLVETMITVFTNKIFLSCLFAWLLAQLFKVVSTSIREKRFAISRIFALGGMPSSHTATITALLLATYLDQQITPLTIAIFIIALIVIRDSFGVRQEVGKHAKVLNKLAARRTEFEKLEELIGHTLPEVVVGGLLGILVPMIIYLL
ncbi:divergent PAP2 family protein [Candidatus Woesearchaeota archaeon]|nr:divergent PAP2 family protein [Candidatus Woesearchaeota archaeon]